MTVNQLGNLVVVPIDECCSTSNVVVIRDFSSTCRNYELPDMLSGIPIIWETVAKQIPEDRMKTNRAQRRAKKFGHKVSK